MAEHLGLCTFCGELATHQVDCRMAVRPPLPDTMAATLTTIQRLDLHLVDCDGALARGIVLRAIAHLEVSLLEYLTGPDGYRRRLLLLPEKA